MDCSCQESDCPVVSFLSLTAVILLLRVYIPFLLNNWWLQSCYSIVPVVPDSTSMNVYEVEQLPAISKGAFPEIAPHNLFLFLLT